MAVDYYEILGVSREAELEEIKRAYRRLARQHHPDVNREDPEAEERFKRISEAYAVLSDQDKRRRYDGGGDSPDFFATGFPNVWEVFQSAFGGNPFGAGPFAPGPPRGRHRAVTVALELADLLAPAAREVTYNHIVRCDHCQGQGLEPGTSLHRCETCHGQGRVARTVSTFLGVMSSVSECPTCGGAGEIPDQLCTHCRGRGVRQRQETVSVEIPAGVEEGDELVVRGGGDQVPGGQSGDLAVRVAVAPHPLFTRRGRDLELTHEVHYLQALLGDTLTLPTLTGETLVPLAAGTQPGDRLEVPGEGLPSRRGGGRGKLVVNVRVRLPQRLTERERELLEELAQHADLQITPPHKGLFERLRGSLGG